MRVLILLSGLAPLILLAMAGCGRGAASAAPILSYKKPPVLETCPKAAFSLGGPLGDRLAANTHGWLLSAPASNPAMLQMFRDRDRQPPRDLLPWSGEFAGKYLISAVQALRLTGDPSLRSHLRTFVSELLSTQREDGYLGPFPSAEGMMGPGRWDLWGQYHVMLGLLEWHDETGDTAALRGYLRCADLFCRVFLDSDRRVFEAGSEEMNESCAHVFALLYKRTGQERYLRMVQEILKDWETPPSGDYIRQALAGKAFWQLPKPRWESLHGLQAIAELYFLTGLDEYRTAFEGLWWSIAEGDRHNTGGFSSGEQATGNPYDLRPIETCCTVAWMAMTLDYLRMTGDSRAADELEISTWNAVLGAQHPTGRWWTYNTPMDGERKASTRDIAFQARPGSPELNCCSVNGPRGLGILSEWAVMTAPDGLALNYYGPGVMAAALPSGRNVRLIQETAYPVDGHVRITVEIDHPEVFRLKLRIPGWSRRTRILVNGEGAKLPGFGAYLELLREWRTGDRLDLDLDLTPRYWAGERDVSGRTSIYRGPILLAYDPRFDVFDPDGLPALQPTDNAPKAAAPQERVATAIPSPLLLVSLPTTDGRSLVLCDFATAGMAGNRYRSWLRVEGPRPVPFSKNNPFRTVTAGVRGKRPV
jgi:DUF1680 family protein